MIDRDDRALCGLTVFFYVKNLTGHIHFNIPYIFKICIVLKNFRLIKSPTMTSSSTIQKHSPNTVHSAWIYTSPMITCCIYKFLSFHDVSNNEWYSNHKMTSETSPTENIYVSSIILQVTGLSGSDRTWSM